MRLTSNISHRPWALCPRVGFAAVVAASAVALVAPAALRDSPVERTSIPLAMSVPAASVTAPSAPAPSAPAPSAPAPSAPAPPAAETDPIAAAVADAQGPRGGAQVGIAVVDRTTGKQTLGRLGSTPFLSASVVKLLTAVDILHRAELGGPAVNPAQRALIKRALTASDDAAMTALWNQFGGPRIITELTGWARLSDTRPPVVPAHWAETKLSPRDVAATYTYLFEALNPVDRQLVLGSLRAATPRGADTFDQSFGLLSPPRRPGVAAKQGWMTIQPNEYLHSTGLIGPNDRYVVVVLTKRPALDGADAGRAAVTAAVNRVVSALTLTPPAAHPPASPPPAAHPAPQAARPAPRHIPYPELRPSPPHRAPRP